MPKGTLLQSSIKKVHDECGNYQKDEYENGKLNTLNNLRTAVIKIDSQHNVSQRSELVCPAGYYPNSTSTGMECIHCGRGKYAH